MKQLKLKTKDSAEIDPDKTVTIISYIQIVIKSNGLQTILLSPRHGGEFESRSFWLNSNFDWHIGIDSVGEMILVPTRR